MSLGLPSRDYFLKASSAPELNAYHRYMTQIAVIMGANASSAANELSHVVHFEQQLANVSIIHKLSPHFCGCSGKWILWWDSYLCSFAHPHYVPKFFWPGLELGATCLGGLNAYKCYLVDT